jgi:hypothetical protein
MGNPQSGRVRDRGFLQCQLGRHDRGRARQQPERRYSAESKIRVRRIRPRTPVCSPLRFHCIIGNEHFLERVESEKCEGGRFSNSRSSHKTNRILRNQRIGDRWRGQE